MKKDNLSFDFSLSTKLNANKFWRLFPAGMRRRWWLFRPFDLIARYWPLFKSRTGLVIVRMDGIGDMVLFRNSLDHYEQAFDMKKKDITIIGCKSWSSLSKNLFIGYKVIGINEHAYGKRIFYRFYINLRVSNLRPKIVVSDSYFRRALLSDSLVWVMRAPNSVVSYPYMNEKTRPEFLYYLSTVSKIIDTGPYPTHELIRHSNFISQVSSKEVKPDNVVLPWRSQIPKNVKQKGSYVLFNIGSNEVGRRWPLVHYLSLAKHIVNLGYKVYFIGKEKDEVILHKIDLVKVEGKILNLINKTNLSTVLDLIKEAALVVTNDSGPAHLSIGLGAPTVVIIGGGHFGSFFPYPPDLTPNKVKFLSETFDCYHCFWKCDKRIDMKDSFPCISKVSYDRVQEACEKTLSNSDI